MDRIVCAPPGEAFECCVALGEAVALVGWQGTGKGASGEGECGDEGEGEEVGGNGCEMHDAVHVSPIQTHFGLAVFDMLILETLALLDGTKESCKIQ